MSTKPHVQSPFIGVHRSRSVRLFVAPALAAVIGGLFVYAGILKAVDPVKFTTDIHNFRILPWQLSVLVAFYLPWLEIITGAALFLGRLRTGALAILTSLTVIFIGATISAQMRGIDLNCGCFGKATENLSFASHLLINSALLAGLLIIWFARQPARSDVHL
jgi:uncharacterized membrane protein YphA (DoxX/SURF4 family)